MGDYAASTKGELMLHFLPDYAPDLNPDELACSHIKRTGVARGLTCGIGRPGEPPFSRGAGSPPARSARMPRRGRQPHRQHAESAAEEPALSL